MAAEDELSRSLQGGHEPCYDYPCSLCEGDGKQVESVKYCEDCFVFMCNPCILSHNRIPLNRRHKLLDEEQFSTVDRQALKSFPTQRCQRHPGELINIFCGDHDVVCCSVCKALDHSNCPNTKHLPEVACGIKNSTEYHDVQKEMHDFLPDIHNVISNIKSEFCRVREEKEQVKSIIADHRKRVDEYFDVLEDRTLDELDLKEKTIVKKLKQQRRLLEKSKHDFDDNTMRLDAFKGDNECELFCYVKSCKNFLYDCKQDVRTISSASPETITFKINSDIENYLHTVNTLGSFEDTSTSVSSSISSQTRTTTSPHASPFQVGANGTQATQNPSGTHNDPTDCFVKYRTSFVENVNVKEKSDTKTCDIYDICQLPDRKFLITDVSNIKLKYLSKSFKFISSVEPISAPVFVCATVSGEAAMSLFHSKIIQFVSVGKKLTLTRSLYIGKVCRGLAFGDDKLYVCCGFTGDLSTGCIKVYFNGDQHLYTLPNPPQHLFAIPKRVAISEDGNHLFVTSFNTDEIAMLDLAGNMVNTFKNKHLRDPAGVCTDDKGHLFVVGKDSNTVVQLSLDQQASEVILNSTNRIGNPKGICYNVYNSQILLTDTDSNTLTVYACRYKP